MDDLNLKLSFRLKNTLEDSMDRKLAFKKFRNTSGYYVYKKEIRQYIFDKYNNMCALCGSENNLEIDHIKSVKRCFTEEDFDFCNTIENLQSLCKTCNCSKIP